MRLTEDETEIIKDVIYDLDSNARIFLFGSRAYSEKKGGDIDLLVLSDSIIQRDLYGIKARLWDKLGEQRIDIIIAKDDTKPFIKIALEEGVEIC